ncbi:MAG: hypothetical protein QOF45_886 [Gaiellaceae bacterium]|jgi:hypothetical protein|nr:hypothetical protein [Gaiellaceae bacterium]
MWHVGALAGTIAAAALEYNHYCTNPLSSAAAEHQPTCASLMVDPHHATWAGLGAVIGGCAGLAYQAYESKQHR